MTVLDRFFGSHRRAVLDAWRDEALQSYPVDTRAFLLREKDRFQNPVGATLATGLEAMLTGLLGGADREALADAADPVVRVRAVQDFSPAAAVGFVFGLKDAARKALGELAATGDGQRAFAELDRRVDVLALAVFERYVACREQVFAIRAGELRRQTSALLERAQRQGGEGASGSGQQPGPESTSSEGGAQA